MPRVRGAARWLALVALLLLAGGFGARVGGPGLAGAAPARLGTFSRKRTQTSAVNDGARPAAQHGGSAAVDLHGHAEVRAPPKPPAPGGGASERRSHAHSTDVSALPEGQDVYDRATSLMSAGRVEEAVQLLCTQEGYKAAGGTEESYHVVSDLATAGYVGGALDWDGTKIAPSPRREAQGDQRLLRAIEESMRKGLALLEVCGFVAMQGVFPPDLTSELRAEADALLDDHLETLSDGDGTANTAASAARSDGRHELKNPMEGPFIDPRLVLRPVVMRVVQEVTKSANLEIDTHSVVTSLPQTPAQFWHRDLSPPHEMAAAEQDLLLPAAGIVMFVPLTDVTERMGPTGMAAGTHLPCPESLRRYGRLYDQFGPNYYSFDEECPDRWGDTVYASSPEGTAILFDSRLMHRGGQNMSNRRRPMVYITYFVNWFQDTINFVPRMKAEVSALPATMRKALNRAATLDYVEMLETELEQRGVDVRSLRFEARDEDASSFRMTSWWGAKAKQYFSNS